MNPKYLTKTFLLLVLICLLLSGFCGTALANETDLSKSVTKLPEKYDLRDFGYVTSVKWQGDWGTCWAFATINAIESNTIMKGYETLETADFSELHLAYYLYNRTGVTVGNVLPELSGLAGDTIKLQSNVNYLHLGGHPFMAMTHLATGLGIVREEKAPYTLLEENPNFVLPPEDAVHDIEYIVSNAAYADFRDMDEVKQLVMTYGCGAFNHYSDLDNYKYLEQNGVSATLYYQNSHTETNHAVSLVGWDDTYPKELFKTEPKNDGAWLVKNSWTEYWGDEGYFWLSYEDTSLHAVVFYDVRPADTVDTIYQYDGSCSLEYYADRTPENGKFSIVAANTFSAKANETITDVAFMTQNKNVDYTVSVLKEDGTVAATESGTTNYCGYHTISLSSPVDVIFGKSFEVQVRLSADATSKDIYGERRLSMPFDASMETDMVKIVSSCEPGQGYVLTNSREIDGSTLMNGKGGNFRIKAFGVNLKPATPPTTSDTENIFTSLLNFILKLLGN